MEPKIMEIAQRIRGLREILEISEEKMAELTDTTVEEYKKLESGEHDFSFTFLYLCANVFGVDIIELLTGDKPRLSFYTVVRSGAGLPIKRNKSFTYQHMAYRMQNKLCEPFVVIAPYLEESQDQEISTSRHKGQEFDFVLKGSLKVRLDDYIEVLGEGDAIFYDSSHKHGMIATGGQDCTFLAIVMGEHNDDTDREDNG